MYMVVNYFGLFTSKDGKKWTNRTKTVKIEEYQKKKDELVSQI
jgi:hypothetical protein